MFNDLSDKTKGFKHQITPEIELKKYKDTEIEFSPVYFNSPTKIVVNDRFDLEKSFQEILYRIDNWINEGSGWIVESIKSQYINISTFRPLIGSSYIGLPVELKNPKKELTNIKNKDKKCFLRCHVKHINPAKIHPERIAQKDKEFINDLNYVGIEFPVSEKNLFNLKQKTTFASMFFVMKTNQPFQSTF